MFSFSVFLRAAPARRLRWVRGGRLLAAVVAGALAAGCAGVALPAWRGARPAEFLPGSFTAAGPIPARVERVVVLPLYSDVWYASDLAALEAALVGELDKAQRFELSSVPRAALARRFGRESFGSSAVLPGDLFAWLRQEYAADAVVFLDLTHYAPYQPIALGLRAKLVDAAGGAPLWSCDTLFDSAQARVAEAARRYQTDQEASPYPVEGGPGSLQSPARFARFAGHAIFATLPPRALP